MLEFLAPWAQCWQLLCDAFPHSPRKASDLELYAERIRDLGIDAIRAAVEQCIATCKYFPTVAELREAAGNVAGALEPTSLDCYGDTMRELSLAMAESRIPKLDPIAKEVVASMGGAITLLVSDNGPTDRAHFTKSYAEKMEQRRRIGGVVPMARAALDSADRERLPAAQERLLPKHGAREQ